MKTQQHHTPISYFIFRCISLCFYKICNSPWHLIEKVLPGRLLQHFTKLSHTCFHISFLTQHLVTNLFIIFQMFSIGFMYSGFPGHSRMGIPLLSRNVLVLLELWHGTRSWIKIFPFCGNTAHSHFISIS